MRARQSLPVSKATIRIGGLYPAANHSGTDSAKIRGLYVATEIGAVDFGLLAFTADALFGLNLRRHRLAHLCIALRQHRALIEPARFQDAPDLGEAPADIAHRPVKDDVPRQHIVETVVSKGQRVRIGLAQAQSEAARGRLAASEVKAGGGTVGRLDGKTMLGEEQCVPTDAATEVENMMRAARL